MVIAVDARTLQTDATEEYKNFTREVILRLVKTYTLHQFILFADSNIDPLIHLPGNATLVILTPKPTNLLLYKWWYDIRIPLALKKYQTDIFICTYGLCSLTTSTPQILIIQDFTFLYYPSFFPKQGLSFYKKFTSGFLKKATAIASFSDFTKREIAGKYAAAEQKITIIKIAANRVFKPLNWEERDKVKEQYAQGCEYFIFTDGLNPEKNLINLLKAFSIFKKRQKTNMKLVITINPSANKDQLEKLNSYKYKNEISLAENLSTQELAQVTAGSYAMILPSLYKGFGAPVLEAMQSEVPVITTADSSMSEIAGEAALYADPESPQEIAEQMKRIFKDEALRSKLISIGKERVKDYSWDKTTSLTWQLIQQIVSR